MLKHGISVLKTVNRRKHDKKPRAVDHTTSEIQSNEMCIVDEAVQMFESKCETVKDFCSQHCQMNGITIRPSKRNLSLCTTCQASHRNTEGTKKDLPIWYDKNKIMQFHLPEELK